MSRRYQLYNNMRHDHIINCLHILVALQSSYTFDDEVVGCERARLVEAADAHFASERDAKRFGTVDAQLVKCHKRVVDCQRQLDRQFGRNDAGDDETAFEK